MAGKPQFWFGLLEFGGAKTSWVLLQGTEVLTRYPLAKVVAFLGFLLSELFVNPWIFSSDADRCYIGALQGKMKGSV